LATSNQATDRDGARALEWAQRAVEARPEDARSRAVLAAAFAESGRFPEANGAILLAMELAETAGDSIFLARLQVQFNAYQKRRPWRE
jgi:Flp pilus assembly protein TadD